MRLFVLCAALVAATCLLACGTADTCTGTDMKCVAVSDCSVDKGHLTSKGVCGDNVSQVCCVPVTKCQMENFYCCTTGAHFRPNCDDGVLTCPANQVQCM